MLRSAQHDSAARSHSASRLGWRGYALLAIAALGLIAGLLWVIQTPYRLVMPGPVADVQRLITPYPDPSGALLLTTVYSDPANAAEWLFGALSPQADLVPAREALPGHLGEHAYQHLLAALMDESKVAAQVVALRAAGYDVRITGQGARVHEVLAGSPAEGRLMQGDIIVGLNDLDVATANDLGAAIQRHLPGETVTLRVHRDGAVQRVQVTLGESPDEPGRGRLGIMALTHLFSYELPREFTISTEDIVGPSAGLALALGIYDAVVPENLTRGHRIAVTGTISTDGTVGPVGGVPHKTVAAEQAGATLFLVPQQNHRDAAGAARSMRVLAVGTFDDALDVLADLQPLTGNRP